MAEDTAPIGDAPSVSNGAMLTSWKEIAAFFRRDVRTVQRWERSEGLPVHRHPHSRQSSVYAYPAELDAWWRRRGPAAAEEAVNEATARDAQAKADSIVTPTPRYGVWRVWATAAVLLIPATAAVVQYVPGDPRAERPSMPPAADPQPTIARLFANLTREGGAGARLGMDVDLAAGVSSPDGRTLYLSAASDNVVLIVDTASMKVTRRIGVSERPGPLAISPDGRRLYIGTYVGRLHVLDTGSGSGTVIESGGPVADVLATGDGRFVYLALQYAGLARLEAATNRIQRLPTVGCPMSLAGDGASLYVSHQCLGPGGTDGHDAVGVFDLSTGKLRARAQGPPQVGGPLAVSPDGAFFWLNGKDACIASRYDHRGCPGVPASIVHVFNTGDLTPARTLAFPEDDVLGGILVLPGGSRAFLGGVQSRVIDTRDFAVVEAVRLGVFYVPIFTADGTAWLLHGREIVRISPLPASCDLPPVGLMDHWPGDGSADDIRADIEGKRTGGSDYRPGVIGEAFAFDGEDDEILVGRPSDPDWAFGSREGTILAWVKFGSLEDEMPLIERTGARTTSPVWRLSKSKENRVVFCMGSGAACEPGPGFRGVVGSTALRAGTWYHIAVTRRRDAVTVYVNGRPDADPASVRFEQDDAPITKRFGVDAAGRHLHGLLDEIAHYTRALDAPEIEAIYRNATAPACTGARER